MSIQCNLRNEILGNGKIVQYKKAHSTDLVKYKTNQPTIRQVP